MLKTTIVTAIPYVNSTPHIGNILTTLSGDVTARYLRMQGFDVFSVAGTDENGLKIKEAAEAQGRDPHEFTAEIAQRFIEIFDGMGMKFDKFVRTSLPEHREASQALFSRLQENGFIYTATYEGWYDVSTETYFKEADLVDGKSPDGNEVRWVSEENYFFKLSAFGDRLLAHIEANPSFIIPETRKNEVVSFIKSGLMDQCVSRKNNGWGIPVPGDESQVIYVWFDALINYITATGWPNPGWEEKWPAEAQWLGKDILTRFHATLWPAMLMGVHLPLPKHVIAHSWILLGSEKISKSKGNAVLPIELAEELRSIAQCDSRIAIDVLRYYLVSTMGFENDTVFTRSDFYARYNSELGNAIGNNLNRTLKIIESNLDGRLRSNVSPESEVIVEVEEVLRNYRSSMDSFRLDRSCECIHTLAKFLGKYIDSRAPWGLATIGDFELLNRVCFSIIYTFRALELMMHPIAPTISDSISKMCGFPPITSSSMLDGRLGLGGELRIQNLGVLFPKVPANLFYEEEALDYLKSQGFSLKSRQFGTDGYSFPDFKLERDGEQFAFEYKMQVNKNTRQLLKEQFEKLATEDNDFKFGGIVYGQNASLSYEIVYSRDGSSLAASNAETPKPMEPTTEINVITIDDFTKVQLRVGRVFEAEPLEGSDKLLKLQVHIGEEKRQIVAGIRANYSPEDLIGRQVVVVYNLKPAKLRGTESQGMLLAATDENGGAILLQPDREAPEGTQVR